LTRAARATNLVAFIGKWEGRHALLDHQRYPFAPDGTSAGKRRAGPAEPESGGHLLLEQALSMEVSPAFQLRQERVAQLAVWEGLAGRWVGNDREIDTMIEDIYPLKK
jgi:hypothetical protein